MPIWAAVGEATSQADVAIMMATVGPISIRLDMSDLLVKNWWCSVANARQFTDRLERHIDAG